MPVMKKYTNKILIITFVVLAIAMVVGLTISILKAKRYLREHPEAARVEVEEAAPEYDVEDTISLSANDLKDSL